MTTQLKATPGKIDPRILDQDQVWIDIRGVTHQLDEMDPHHRANVANFLRRRAGRLQLPDDPSDGVWAAMMEDDAQYDLDAVEWIETKPLMRRLVALDTRGPIGKASTKVRNKTYRARRSLGMAR